MIILEGQIKRGYKPSAPTYSDGAFSSTNKDASIGLTSSRHSTRVWDSSNFTSAITAAYWRNSVSSAAVDSEELPSACGPGVDEREIILGVSPGVGCCIHSVVGKDQNRIIPFRWPGGVSRGLAGAVGGSSESRCDNDLVSATSVSKSDVRAVAHRRSGPSTL